MTTKLKGAVGEGGRNLPDDVRLVQTELGRRVVAMGLPALPVTGVSSPQLVRAIRRFQRLCVGLRRGDGRISPGGQTERALFDPLALTGQLVSAAVALPRLSGAAWWHLNQARFPNSSRVVDLAPGFSDNAQRFIAALRRAGATVAVNATRRNRHRAYLMHYSWQVAHGAVMPWDVPADPDVEIDWDHDDLAASQAAAREMVALFGIAFKPSLTSNHIRGTAIDMTIDWSQAIDVVDGRGRTVRVDRPRSGATNETLHAIGSSYGVLKLRSDPPHWSADGH